MTLYFLKPSYSYTYAIPFSINTGGVTDTTVTIELVSDYSKKELNLEASVLDSNDRYTEFLITYTDEIGDGDYSGFYQYTITGDQTSVIIETGFLKLVNNKEESLQNQTKYPSSNENGASYVIY